MAYPIRCGYFSEMLFPTWACMHLVNIEHTHQACMHLVNIEHTHQACMHLVNIEHTSGMHLMNIMHTSGMHASCAHRIHTRHASCEYRTKIRHIACVHCTNIRHAPARIHSNCIASLLGPPLLCIWCERSATLCSPNEDFGRPSKHSGTHFQSTFQIREYSIWATFI